MNINTTYNEMWQRTLPLLKSGIVETDPMIFNKKDTRRGMTLLFRPPAHLVASIQSFLQAAQQIEPNQYYYPSTDLHLTVLTIISCQPDFKRHDINVSLYQPIIEEALSTIPPFKIRFQGVTASPNAILIKGYPESNGLELLRHRLREGFKRANLKNSIDHRYAIRTAHLTVIRFRENIKEPTVFADFLEKHLNTSFGLAEINKIELVFNDWYQRAVVGQKIGKYNLAETKF